MTNYIQPEITQYLKHKNISLTFDDLLNNIDTQDLIEIITQDKYNFHTKTFILLYKIIEIKPNIFTEKPGLLALFSHKYDKNIYLEYNAYVHGNNNEQYVHIVILLCEIIENNIFDISNSLKYLVDFIFENLLASIKLLKILNLTNHDISNYVSYENVIKCIEFGYDYAHILFSNKQILIKFICEKYKGKILEFAIKEDNIRLTEYLLTIGFNLSGLSEKNICKLYFNCIKLNNINTFNVFLKLYDIKIQYTYDVIDYLQYIDLMEIINLPNFNNLYYKYKILYAILFNYFNNYYKIQNNDSLELDMINNFAEFNNIIDDHKIETINNMNTDIVKFLIERKKNQLLEILVLNNVKFSVNDLYIPSEWYIESNYPLFYMLCDQYNFNNYISCNACKKIIENSCFSLFTIFKDSIEMKSAIRYNIKYDFYKIIPFLNKNDIIKYSEYVAPSDIYSNFETIQTYNLLKYQDKIFLCLQKICENTCIFIPPDYINILHNLVECIMYLGKSQYSKKSKNYITLNNYIIKYASNISDTIINNSLSVIHRYFDYLLSNQSNMDIFITNIHEGVNINPLLDLLTFECKKYLVYYVNYWHLVPSNSKKNIVHKFMYVRSFILPEIANNIFIQLYKFHSV